MTLTVIAAIIVILAAIKLAFEVGEKIHLHGKSAYQLLKKTLRVNSSVRLTKELNPLLLASAELTQGVDISGMHKVEVPLPKHWSVGGEKLYMLCPRQHFLKNFPLRNEYRETET